MRIDMHSLQLFVTFASRLAAHPAAGGLRRLNCDDGARRALLMSDFR